MIFYAASPRQEYSIAITFATEVIGEQMLCSGKCREYEGMPRRQQELVPLSEGCPKPSAESVKGSIAKSAEAWQLYGSQAVFPASMVLGML